ncbi:MAG: hypothetical protein Q4C67_10370 [Deinococcus sp.]|nr:hypothetical protein [Deinococcus sp.]
MKAKSALFLAALALPLSACGNVGHSGPSAGELLRAPTTLSLAGRTLSAAARPVLEGERLHTQVLIHSSASTLPLNVQSVYLVTQGGVWQAAGRWRASSCGAGCRAVEASGPAQGLRSGEQVQVVVRLQDSAGRNFWLRDEQAAVQRSEGAAH